MATSNFSRSGWDKHYTIFCDHEDCDNGDCFFDWDMIKSDLQEAVEAVGGSSLDQWKSYPDRQILGAIEVQAYNHEWKDYETVDIMLVLEAGYYEGAMINYELSHDDLEWIRNKRTLANIQSAIDKLEGIAASHSTNKLIRVATFSNGETIYEDVDQLLRG